ncbi:uncharacterized protein IL334_002454 [Kwoniella shivajii]|uniref:Uncharacterized protein n=1 Tax=Kwoniella shivajii TaxID=564305 RepID=A0ABZ1CWG7_9TREE|nr:hypothetical protein IL334_002454 [Kwoniella shivajii]
MSSTISSTSVTSSTSYPTQTYSNNNNTNPGSFYKNLFYILIGLLVAFGLVSFFSLMRARKRRYAIVREAERLGVIVPGVPGYIPLRDRRHLNWLRPDGSNLPDWWEVEKFGDGSEKMVSNEMGVGGQQSLESEEEFHPLAIIPPTTKEDTTPPVPFSSLPYFPNHLAYRPESLIPVASKFTNISDPSILNELVGEQVEVVTVIRMPMPPEFNTQRRNVHEGDDDDSEDVIREWAGVELGITSIGVKTGNEF